MRVVPLASLLIALGTAPSHLLAQTTVADSAAAARTAFRAAGEAVRAGDSVAALNALERAARVWPQQSAYALAAARFAGRLGLMQRALPQLEALTLLGAEWAENDEAFGRVKDDPAFRAAAARNRASLPEMARSRVLWDVGNSTLLVEGVAADTVAGRYFISSVRTGRIFVLQRDGGARAFVTPDSGSLIGVLGMAVDNRRGLLWATTAEISGSGGDFPTYSGKSALVAFDLSTGVLRATVQLPEVEGGHQLGDVIVTARGTVFTSDSRYPALYRVPVGPIPTRVDVVVDRHPLFRSLQGMAVSAEESGLYLADYSHGLFHVDLGSGEVTVVAGPTGSSLLGIDGMVDDGPDRLIAVQNGITPVRVVGLDLDPSGRRVTRLEVLDRPELKPGEATLGVRVGRSFVYVATVPASLRTLELDR